MLVFLHVLRGPILECAGYQVGAAHCGRDHNRNRMQCENGDCCRVREYDQAARGKLKNVFMHSIDCSHRELSGRPYAVERSDSLPYQGGQAQAILRSPPCRDLKPRLTATTFPIPIPAAARFFSILSLWGIA